MKEKIYVDETFAFWASCTDEEVDLHLNEWYTPTKCYMDIGVRICKLEKSDTLFVYLPICLKEDSIIDLFDTFNNKEYAEQAACSVFNGKCEIIFLDDIINIKHGLRNDYVVKISKYLTLQEVTGDSDKKAEGTLLKFNLQDLKEKYKKKDLYFRFRIRHPHLEKKFLKKGRYSESFKTPNRNTQIHYIQHINEVRLLPQSVFQEYGDIDKQYIGKVMSMIATEDKYDLDDDTCYKIRKSESFQHKFSAPKEFQKKSALIYQWKAVNDKEGPRRTNAFVFKIKINKIESKLVDVIRYCLIGALTFFATNLIWFYISELLKK